MNVKIKCNGFSCYLEDEFPIEGDNLVVDMTTKELVILITTLNQILRKTVINEYEDEF